MKADQRGRGRYLGGTVPFGWAIGSDGELIPVPEQQKAIEKMVDLRRQGLSFRTISKMMRGAGLAALSHAGVAKIISAAGSRAGN